MIGPRLPKSNSPAQKEEPMGLSIFGFTNPTISTDEVFSGEGSPEQPRNNQTTVFQNTPRTSSGDTQPGTVPEGCSSRSIPVDIPIPVNRCGPISTVKTATKHADFSRFSPRNLDQLLFQLPGVDEEDLNFDNFASYRHESPKNHARLNKRRHMTEVPRRKEGAKDPRKEKERLLGSVLEQAGQMVELLNSKNKCIGEKMKEFGNSMMSIARFEELQKDQVFYSAMLRGFEGGLRAKDSKRLFELSSTVYQVKRSDLELQMDEMDEQVMGCLLDLMIQLKKLIFSEKCQNCENESAFGKEMAQAAGNDPKGCSSIYTINKVLSSRQYFSEAANEVKTPFMSFRECSKFAVGSLINSKKVVG